MISAPAPPSIMSSSDVKIGAITPPVTPALEKPGIIVSESEVPKIIAMAY
jgi:hypothetical protein